jgi:hypothetical protein
MAGWICPEITPRGHGWHTRLGTPDVWTDTTTLCLVVSPSFKTLKINVFAATRHAYRQRRRNRTMIERSSIVPDRCAIAVSTTGAQGENWRGLRLSPTVVAVRQRWGSAAIMSISILVARRSALADLSNICVTIASRLVILRRYPSVDRHKGSLVPRVCQERRQALGAAAAAVAGLALLEAGVQRRPARTHVVIAPAVRHAPPSVASRNRSRG